jgi:nicotinate-nucleotide pyrophosphorylase (carboxylating)
MSTSLFHTFFSGRAMDMLLASIEHALDEDGPDLTSRALFRPEDELRARIVAKERCIVAGLPLAPLVLERCGGGRCEPAAQDGDTMQPGTLAAELRGPAAGLLKAERVILNYVTHLSGIATLTRRYVDALATTRTRVLDTRKTLPGLRHAEKYAVRVGGGVNHRMDLAEMLMLKDNHVDRAGGITPAVERLRAAYSPCPPLEVECRTLDEVREAVACGVDRIMLDNMGHETMARALALIPDAIESEVSGGVSLETIKDIGRLGPDFVSVGRLTHSAPAADFSMQVFSE